MYEKDGIWVLDINKNPYRIDKKEAKKLKSPHAKRLIPLHPVLVETLNFPGFADSVRQQGHDRIFHHLKKEKGKFGHTPGKMYSRFKSKLTFTPSEGKKDFHSFRHTFGNQCKQKNLNDKMADQVFGHAPPKRLLDNTYSEVFPVKVTYEEVILKMDFEIDLSHLAKSKWVVPKKYNSKVDGQVASVFGDLFSYCPFWFGRTRRQIWRGLGNPPLFRRSEK